MPSDIRSELVDSDTLTENCEGAVNFMVVAIEEISFLRSTFPLSCVIIEVQSLVPQEL